MINLNKSVDPCYKAIPQLEVLKESVNPVDTTMKGLKPKDPFESLPPSAPISKNQKKKNKNKVVQSNEIENFPIAKYILNPDLFKLSTKSVQYSQLIFNNISFESSLSIIDAWAIFYSKTVNELTTLISEKFGIKGSIDFLHNDFAFFYYELQLHYQKLVGIHEKVYVDAFNCYKFFLSQDRMLKDLPRTSIDAIYAIIPQLKSQYLSRVKCKSANELWNKIEENIKRKCELLVQGLDFMKEIMLHPQSRVILIDAAKNIFPDSVLMDSKDPNQTISDLKVLMKLMEDSIDLALKKGLIGGYLIHNPCTRIRKLLEEIKTDRTYDIKDFDKFFQVEDEVIGHIDNLIEYNQTQLVEIRNGLTHDMWCTLNNVQKATEKTTLEFQSMILQCCVNGLIFKDFVNIFFVVLSQRLQQIVSPDRFEINASEAYKLDFSLFLMETIIEHNTWRTLIEAQYQALKFNKENPIVSKYGLLPFFEKLVKNTDNYLSNCENYWPKDKVRKFLNQLKGIKTITLKEVYKLKQNNLSFVEESGTYLTFYKKFKQDLTDHLQTVISSQPYETAMEDKAALQEILSDWQYLTASWVIVPLSTASGLTNLVVDTKSKSKKDSFGDIDFISKLMDDTNIQIPLVDISCFYVKKIPPPSLELPILAPLDLNITPIAEPSEDKHVIEEEIVPKEEVIIEKSTPKKSVPAKPKMTPVKKAPSKPPSPPLSTLEDDEAIPNTTKLRKLLKILKDEGFKKVRQSGSSHQILSNGERIVIVPTNKSQFKPGTFNSILKMADLK